VYDGVEFVHLCFDVCNQLELGTAAVEVVSRVVGLEVGVAVEIVCEETGTAFKGHQLDGEGKKFEFLVGDGRKSFDEAAGERFKLFYVKPDLGEILFVFCAAGTAETESIAVVVQERTGHNGVKVNDADAFAGLFIQHNIVQLGVVVGNAERNGTVCKRVHDHGAVRFAVENELDFFRNFIPAACEVVFHSLLEIVKANLGVWKLTIVSCSFSAG